MRLPWHKYFMSMAKLAAVRSGCNSRPTGAVIVKDNRVIATGYNGSIAGQPQCTDKGVGYCLHREKGVDDSGAAKYQDCPAVHAEQNAINYAARYGGISLDGAEIYCTLFPCKFCMDNIASVGICEIYYELPYASNDIGRDNFWEMRASLYNIYVQQIRLSPDDKASVFDIMCHEPSARRIE